MHSMFFIFSIMHFIASSGHLNQYDSNNYVAITSKSGDNHIFPDTTIWKYLGRVSILLCHYIYLWSFSIRSSNLLALNRRRRENSVLKELSTMCNNFCMCIDLPHI